MPVNLGEARGSVTITTEGVTRAERVVKRSSANMTRDFEGVGKGVGGLVERFNKLDRVLGASVIIGAVTGFGRLVLELGKTAAQAELTEQSFQKMAAGVGESGDKLLESMRAASRGVITDSNLILGANRAIGSGVAGTAEELSAILEVARATGQAYGKTTTEAFERIVQAVSKLEPELLDELGITVRLDQVFRSYATSLGTTAERLTDAQRKQAFLNEIMRQSADEVRAAADSGDNVADKYERMTVATENLGKAWGDLLNSAGGPNVVDFISAGLNNWSQMARDFQADLEKVGATWRRLLGMAPAATPGVFGTAPWGTRGAPPGVSADSGIEDRAALNAVKLDWAKGVTEVNDRLHADIIESERSYGRQRVETVRDYQLGVSREAEDFARQRTNAERQLQMSILDIHQDSARQRVRWEADLARSIARAQADSAETIAEAREDANKRLTELDEDYQRNREKAARAHGKSLRDAAGDLDAKAVADLQYNYKLEEQEAKEAHDEQRKELQEQLAERIKDEEEALAESIQMQREAYARQLADQAENDALRIADMKAAFEEQKAQEDIERGIRLQRQATDHANQLIEMDRQHGEDIAQLQRHAADARTKLDEEAEKELIRLEKANDEVINKHKAREEAHEDLWDKFMDHVGKSLSGPGFAGGGFTMDSLGNKFAPPAPPPPSYNPVPGWERSRNNGGGAGASISGVNINIYPTPEQSPQAIAGVVRTEVIKLLGEVAG